MIPSTVESKTMARVLMLKNGSDVSIDGTGISNSGAFAATQQSKFMTKRMKLSVRKLTYNETADMQE